MDDENNLTATQIVIFGLIILSLSMMLLSFYSEGVLQKKGLFSAYPDGDVEVRFEPSNPKIGENVTLSVQVCSYFGDKCVPCDRGNCTVKIREVESPTEENILGSYNLSENGTFKFRYREEPTWIIVDVRGYNVLGEFRVSKMTLKEWIIYRISGGWIQIFNTLMAMFSGILLLWGGKEVFFTLYDVFLGLRRSENKLRYVKDELEDYVSRQIKSPRQSESDSSG